MKKNLSHANRIMHDLCKKDKRFTPITNKDYDLFNSYFQKEKHTYGNSWTYITQGVYGIGPQNLGYKFYDGKNIAVVCVYPKMENPEINVFYWIRPMGDSVLDKIGDYSQSLLNNIGIYTYVKKIFYSQFEYLKKNGFKDISYFPWHSACPSEDDTYSEQIFDVKETIKKIKALQNKKYLKKMLLRSSRQQEEYNIQLRDDDFSKNAWNIANEFFHSKNTRRKKINLSCEDDYYNMIFEKEKRNNLYKKIIFSNNQPLGFFVIEKQDNTYSSFYALLILRDRIKILPDYIWIYIFNHLETPFFNAGGSEDEGIHKFKRKFFPVKEQKMYWATNKKT